MLIVVTTLSNFLDWLNMLMEQEGITPADIARTGYVTDSAISLLLSGKTKSVSVEMCKAVAKASDIPLITVYRMAGILPQINKDDREAEEIFSETQDLTSQEKQEVLAFIRMKKNLRKKNGHR